MCEPDPENVCVRSISSGFYLCVWNSCFRIVPVVTGFRATGGYVCVVTLISRRESNRRITLDASLDKYTGVLLA